jgi:hypothetical protein
MIKWIKDQLNYRTKYLAALEDNREAAKNALMVLGKYEALTASLPLDHELSTQNYWKEYADRVFMKENGNLRNSLLHLQEVHRRMVNEWQDGISRYGVQMYGKWQPAEIAPDNTEIIVTDGTSVCLASKRNGVWISAGFPFFADTITHWMAVPEVPRG